MMRPTRLCLQDRGGYGAASRADAERWLSRYRNDFPLRDIHQPSHGAGSDDGAMLRIGLVIALDIIEIVEVIHHQPVGLLQRPLGRVGEPIEPLKPRAIAEMETGDGVNG